MVSLGSFLDTESVKLGLQNIRQVVFVPAPAASDRHSRLFGPAKRI
jgi:hypothetical protein